MNYILEVICFNIESCIIAQASGAHRIELCDNPSDGGTTPSFGFIKSARKILSVELYPIIRPRGGDFLYSNHAFNIMKTDVRLCKDAGCDGVVFGILNGDGTVDKERCSQLVELAYPMAVTFHRGFDRTSDPFKAMEDIIEIGCERILTSGQHPTAMEGAGLISQLIQQANERIVFMPGSGVNSGNIADIAKQTRATEFHSSARIFVHSEMEFNNPIMKEDPHHVSADAVEIKKMLDSLNQLQKENVQS